MCVNKKKTPDVKMEEENDEKVDSLVNDDEKGEV